MPERRLEAQGQADANAVLTKSLTPEVVAIRQQETMVKMAEKGTVFVVEPGTGSIVNVSPKSGE